MAAQQQYDFPDEDVKNDFEEQENEEDDQEEEEEDMPQE